MMRTLLRPAVLHGVATVCAIAACVVFVWRPSFSGRAAAPSVPPRITTATAPVSLVSGDRSETDSLASIVIAGNIFSATRQAPRSRFVPPGEAAVMASTMNGAMDSTSAMNEGSLADSLPRLTGIVTTNGERRALVQFALTDGAPQLYAVGDARAGFRVLRIESDKVVLATRGGSRTLRLSPKTPPDSLGKQP
jgi:hypothetical protein